MDFFRYQTAPVLSGHFDHSFWSHWVLRVADSEPAVRHAVVAIASLHEKSVTMRVPSTHADSFSLFQYNKAIRQLTDRAMERQSNHVVLLTCVLFICLEFLGGNPDLALGHLQNGMKIASAGMTGNNTSNNSDGSAL